MSNKPSSQTAATADSTNSADNQPPFQATPNHQGAKPQTHPTPPYQAHQTDARHQSPAYTAYRDPSSHQTYNADNPFPTTSRSTNLGEPPSPESDPWATPTTGRSPTKYPASPTSLREYPPHRPFSGGSNTSTNDNSYSFHGYYTNNDPNDLYVYTSPYASTAPESYASGASLLSTVSSSLPTAPTSAGPGSPQNPPSNPPRPLIPSQIFGVPAFIPTPPTNSTHNARSQSNPPPRSHSTPRSSGRSESASARHSASSAQK